jgi:HEAT repeat protein
MALLAASPALAWDEAIDSVMYWSPELPTARKVIVFPERVKAPWLEALRRPEADYLCQAALTIALAHRRGMPGLETAVKPLLETLDRPDLHPSVRLAIVGTLIKLDAREAADALFRLAESGNQSLRQEIEPALARWDYKPAREVWLDRLRRSEASNNGVLLAARALGEVREPKAVPALLDLVLSSSVLAPVRLEAAKALGTIRVCGSEADAKRLMTSEGVSGLNGPDAETKKSRSAFGTRHPALTTHHQRLAAAFLLRHHQGEEAVRLLLELARDSEPAVAVVALTRMVEIDPKLVVPDVKSLLANPDAKVRSAAVEVLFREPSEEHIQLLADRLNDLHPDVRIKARKSLHDLAPKAEYRKGIIEQAMRILAGSDWCGLEQATILLGQLEHKPAASRLVELLKFPRPEVFVSAAWGLRRLAVPETLPAALEYYRTAGERGANAPAAGEKGGAPSPPGSGPPRGPAPLGPIPAGAAAISGAIDDQLSQLGQFFGQSRYRPADSALRQRFPRPGTSLVPIETRASAIWALGRIHEGQPDTALVQGFLARLDDGGGPSRLPENHHVRSMAAVALGRMKAKDALPSLRFCYIAKKPSLDQLNNACGWAIEQIAGERIPPPGDEEVRAEMFRNWLQRFEPKP